jgi:hypothetical protein
VTGSFPVSFKASNGIGAEAVQSFTLTVLGLHVTTTSLPTATTAVPYSYQLTSAGGIVAPSWHVITGKPPKGISLNAAGLLHGKASTQMYPHGGSFTFTVEVRSRLKKVSETATATFTLQLLS